MSDVSISLGLSAEQLYTELQTAQQHLVSFAAAAKTAGDQGAGSFGSYTQSLERATDAEGGFFRSNHRVATQIGRLAQEFTSGAGGIQIFGQALESAERALNLPLGALGGLVAAGVLAIEISKIGAAAQKLHEEIESVSRAASQNPHYESLSELQKQFAETSKKAEEASKSSTNFFSVVAEGIYRSFTTGRDKKLDENIRAIGQEREADAAKIQEALAKERTGIAGKAREANDETETRETKGTFAAEREKVEKTREEKVGEAIKQGNVPLQAEANREAELALAAIDRKEEAQKRAIELEEKLVKIKEAGRDVDVASAQAKLDAAEKNLSAPHAAEDAPKLQLKVDESKEAVLAAEKKQADALETHREKVAEKERKFADESLNPRERLLSLQKELNELQEKGKSTSDEDDRLTLKEKQLDIEKEIKSTKAEIDRAAKEALREKLREQAPDEKRDFEAQHRALNPAGLSLHDIASSRVIGGVETHGPSAGALAREAESEEKKARDRQLHGDVAGAQQHQNRAEQLKKALGLDNQIDRDALKKVQEESRDYLKAIAKNTDDSSANK